MNAQINFLSRSIQRLIPPVTFPAGPRSRRRPHKKHCIQSWGQSHRRVAWLHAASGQGQSPGCAFWVCPGMTRCSLTNHVSSKCQRCSQSADGGRFMSTMSCFYGFVLNYSTVRLLFCFALCVLTAGTARVDYITPPGPTWLLWRQECSPSVALRALSPLLPVCTQTKTGILENYFRWMETSRNGNQRN